MKITLDSAKVVDRKDYIAKFLVQKIDRTDFSAVFVESTKSRHKARMKGAARLYFILAGERRFIINGKEEVARVNDLFIINDNDVYQYKGPMKMFEVNIPATDSSNDEPIE